jgi:ferredoxin|tara:strand:- start:120 stop:341 length:222 start_codon:yes stop_codon:yes gene_type:complete
MHTCTKYVQDEWYDKVGEPTDAELDMIDLAYNQKDTSRLGCQVILKSELNNAVFKIPRGANNIMDFIPFDDNF